MPIHIDRGMNFGIREAIVLGSLLISVVGFIAKYNQMLGEQNGTIAALHEQVHKLEDRMQVAERDIRECRS